MITLAEYKAYKNITTSDQDALITTLIPYAQDIIENYLDRQIISRTNTEWVEADDNNYLFLENYPINRVIYIGVPQPCVNITGDTASMTIITEPTGIYIYATPTATPTEFLFTTYPTLAQLKTAIEAAGLGLTFTITVDTATRSELLMPAYGTNLYYADKYDGVFRTIDNRTLSIVFESYFYQGLGERLVYIIYTSGYAIADVPKALKSVCINMVSDMVNVLSPATNSSIKSESLGDYSYSLDDVSNLAGDICKKYAGELEGFRKLFI